jgi:hypothetical protein
MATGFCGRSPDAPRFGEAALSPLQIGRDEID